MEPRYNEGKLANNSGMAEQAKKVNKTAEVKERGKESNVSLVRKRKGFLFGYSGDVKAGL